MEVIREFQREITPENVQVVIDEAEQLTNLINVMLDIIVEEEKSRESN